jgi:hypothetical protein
MRSPAVLVSAVLLSACATLVRYDGRPTLTCAAAVLIAALSGPDRRRADCRVTDITNKYVPISIETGCWRGAACP